MSIHNFIYCPWFFKLQVSLFQVLINSMTFSVFPLFFQLFILSSYITVVIQSLVSLSTCLNHFYILLSYGHSLLYLVHIDLTLIHYWLSFLVLYRTDLIFNFYASPGISNSHIHITVYTQPYWVFQHSFLTTVYLHHTPSTSK